MENEKNAAESKPPTKNKMVIFRATPAEISLIKENAKRHNMSMSRYLRYRAMFDKE